MARGRKDYEKAVIAVQSEGYTDLHGRILMNDNFEDTPFKWATAGTGTWFADRQARAAYNGSYGAELDVTSDAPPAQRTAQMLRLIPIDVTQRLEFQMFWRANFLARMNHLEVWVQYYDGADAHSAVIRYDGINEIWEYRDSTGAMTNLPGSEQIFFDGSWNELSLSVDFATDRYITFKSNNMEINMGDIACRMFGNPLPARLYFQIRTGNITANQLLVSIDDAVVKELEV